MLQEIVNLLRGQTDHIGHELRAVCGSQTRRRLFLSKTFCHQAGPIVEKLIQIYVLRAGVSGEQKAVVLRLVCILSEKGQFISSQVMFFRCGFPGFFDELLHPLRENCRDAITSDGSAN